MAINPQQLLERDPDIVRQTVSPEKCILYALGVGASELEFVFEERLKVLPTMAVVLGYPGFIWRDPALGAQWETILHGEQSVEIHNPLPTQGEVVGTARIKAIYDKGPGKGAVVITERKVSDGGG